MTKIQNSDMVARWLESVDRVLVTAGALKACVKAFSEGGSSAEPMWDATEGTRAALKAAMREEQSRYAKMIEPPAQQEMGLKPGEATGPRALAPPAPKQLPPSSAVAED